MKKIAALGLAGLMGVSALAMTAGTASADPGGDWWKHRHYDHHWDGDHHWNGGGGWGWGGPFVLGLGLGTMYGYGAAPYPDYGYGGGWDGHVRWCESQYRTYSPATDTFFIRPGVPARCIAPFDR
jgi:hypothetical protein